MRILWLGHNLAYPPKGGLLQRNYNLLREAAKSCEVHVLAFDHRATRPAGESPDDCVRVLRKFCASVDWLPLSRGGPRGNQYWLALRGLISRDPFDFHWLRSSQMTEMLQNLLNKIPFDVVHFDTLGLAQHSPSVRESAVVLNHHNIESSMMMRRASLERNMVTRHYWRREAKKLREAERKWCPQFESNLVVSEEDAHFLVDSIPGVQTAVVPNGVDTDYFVSRPDPGGKILLFCGGLDWYPNREAMKLFFDTIWTTLTDRIRDVEIYVVGARPPKWLQRLSAMDNRVHVPGFVDDVRPYFRRATAYVCPITDGGGTRLKILDALAMGVPLIGTSFACSGLGLKNGKHVLLAETPWDFVYRIKQLLADESLRRSLAMAGREIVEKEYSWTVIGKSLVEAYEDASRAQRKRTHDAVRHPGRSHGYYPETL